MSVKNSSSVVGVDSLEHAQSVLKHMRSRGASARNYQTMELANLSEGERGLNEFNSIIIDSGKEVIKKQEDRQKETAILDLIGGQGGPSANKGAASNPNNFSVSHTLRSDRYELSPSKLSALAKDTLKSEAGFYYSSSNQQGQSGMSGKMERMAINRPRKTLLHMQDRKAAADDDDDFLASGSDEEEDAPYNGTRPDSPPSNRGYSDEPKYDSDDDVQSLTPSEITFGSGNARVTKNKSQTNGNAQSKMGNNNGDSVYFACIKQGTTSTMTNGVKKTMITSPQSSPDGPSGRITVNNPVEATSKESQEFADGLKYMMEANLNPSGAGALQKDSRKGPGSVSGSLASSKSGSLYNGSIATSVSSSASTGGGGANMNVSVGGKSAIAMDMAKKQGAVLKKGGLFVRAGGLRKAVRGGADAK